MIHLIFIIYLVLVYNYNTIKYIYFISLRQRVGMYFVKKKENHCSFRLVACGHVSR